MNSKRMDRRIQFQVRGGDKDSDFGTPDPQDWGEFHTCWASVEDVLPSKAETLVGEVMLGRSVKRITIRWVRGITQGMRILVPQGSPPFGAPSSWSDSPVFNIVSGPAEPAWAHRRQWLQVIAEEVTTSGEAV